MDFFVMRAYVLSGLRRPHPGPLLEEREMTPPPVGHPLSEGERT